MGGNGFIYVIGFLAQAFFSARIIFQWVLSEKAKKVVSPSIFWILSIAGSYLLCIYGWLRDDFSIIFGQFISYYIYLWNLNEKGIWNKLHGVLKTLLVLRHLLLPVRLLTLVLLKFHSEPLSVRLSSISVAVSLMTRAIHFHQANLRLFRLVAHQALV